MAHRKRAGIASTSKILAVAAVSCVVLIVAYEFGVNLIPPPSSEVPIDHIIVVMQENRTFDNYFWTYPGQVGYDAALCVPLNPSVPALGCMKPHLTTNPVLMNDIPHDWSASWGSYNNGLMNGFLRAANANPDVMGYYDVWVGVCGS